MSWSLLWFVCFAISALSLKSAKKKLSEMNKKFISIADMERQAHSKLIQANDTLRNAQNIEQNANRIKMEALLTVETVTNQNKVYHDAIEEVVNLWVNDSWKSITDKIKPDNHAQQKARLEKVFDTCRKYGIDFDGRQERAFYVRLESAWKEEVSIQKAKDEQARIREIMKEEQRAEKMRASELKKIEQERKELDKKQAEHNERIKLLKEMESLKQLTADQQKELTQALNENELLQKEIEDSERRKSMAELTRAGHIYVISNIGSFGKDIYKVGMTRRLIPQDRIKELGDASVPFPFDIHLMVATEDAPTLENKLHEELWQQRVNLVNDGKEFFSTDIKTIKTFVDKHGGKVSYEFKEIPEASQWRESQARRKAGELGKYEELTYIEPDEEVA